MTDLDPGPIDAAAALTASEDPSDAAMPAPTVPSRPEHVPEKFWDAAGGAIRTEALLKSYVELERTLGRTGFPAEGELDAAAMERVLHALGRPESPDGYQIQAPHALVGPDERLNAKLHTAGFTQQQAQLVYDLAAEHLVPVIQDAVQELEVRQQVERLQNHFGGSETWREVSRQVATWAAANLEPQVYEALSTSYDGVLAMHQMMRSAEPELIEAAGSSAPLNEAALGEMVRDPRYWRERDPEFIARVTRGFRQLYST